MNSKHSTFRTVFKKLTGHEPFPWQEQIASLSELPSLVRVPTGLGKTAAVVISWLWRRRFAEQETQQQTQRRLVYCLPMRVLVEQTRDEAKKWIEKLGNDIGVHLLMGGEDIDDWDLHPERDAILIGTQDMLLSRALNRGYGMSRYRWPMHFGLLSNDCLWVFDEVQLMNVGAATSAQLEAFRGKVGTSNNTHCLWMSATLDPDWLVTVDMDRKRFGELFEISKDDRAQVKDRLEAVKPLTKAPAEMADYESVANAIASAHQAGSRTLAVFNTVKRATEVYEKIKGRTEAEVEMIHSRFRPPERRKKMQKLLAKPSDKGTIAVTTQVVEAGVDVSARTLFTELAPWASLVQRFGRCNRRGEFNKSRDAHVYWFDADDESLENLALPYDSQALQAAREHIRKLIEVSPATLEQVEAEMRLEPAHVIRRRDLIDLFDTTPDLAGNDIDISRFIRSGEELDVQVFWRDWGQPNDYEPPPEDKLWRRTTRDELCSAPVGQFKKFATDAKRKNKVWRWDYLDGKWIRPDKDAIYPGQTYLVHASAGGYDLHLGWCGEAAMQAVDPLGPTESKGLSDDAYEEDGLSKTDRWQTIAGHTEEVVTELGNILDALGLPDTDDSVLKIAARWHDWGKAHEKFQIKIDNGEERAATDSNGQPLFRRERPDEWRGCRVVAKAPGERKDHEGNVQDTGFWSRITQKDGGRIHFRHELASALAILQRPHPDLRKLSGDDLDLLAYLIAAHHGKVRLSIRSMPNELRPRDEEGQRRAGCRFARGVWDGDELPEVDLGDGITSPRIILSLEPMEIGHCEEEPFKDQPSWLERTLRLRDKLGPFRLAYLEALLRAADMRASERAAQSQESTS